jgi:hypothetical protein
MLTLSSIDNILDYEIFTIKDLINLIRNKFKNELINIFSKEPNLSEFQHKLD